jgi:hypothetical protein
MYSSWHGDRISSSFMALGIKYRSDYPPCHNDAKQNDYCQLLLVNKSASHFEWRWMVYRRISCLKVRMGKTVERWLDVSRLWSLDSSAGRYDGIYSCFFFVFYHRDFEFERTFLLSSYLLKKK